MKGVFVAEKIDITDKLEDKIQINNTTVVKDPKDYEDSEVLYNKLIETIKKYHPATDFGDIKKAYDMAFAAHKDQKRRSGEPYIIHPVSVAIILAELELDKESIIIATETG